MKYPYIPSNAEFPSLAEVRREEVDDIYVLPALQEDKKNRWVKQVF